MTKRQKRRILIALKNMEFKMLTFRNNLPITVQVPNNKKKQIALAVCQEIDEMLYLDNEHYDWTVKETLGDLFRVDNIIAIMLDENLSARLNKRLDLTGTDYNFDKLDVLQLIDVVYAKYNDLPLPDFCEPTFIEKFKRYFVPEHIQKIRE